MANLSDVVMDGLSANAASLFSANVAAEMSFIPADSVAVSIDACRRLPSPRSLMPRSRNPDAKAIELDDCFWPMRRNAHLG